VEFAYKKKGLTQMRCIRPLKATLNEQGDIVYNIKDGIKGLEPFQFDCRKCLPCRLNIAREKSVRAFHEAKTHEFNIFLTLTYNDENLKSDRLDYRDFQLFMKSLRERQYRGMTKDEIKENAITYMVTGEYGELNKRPHWHAIIFNYRPKDAKLKYITDNGEKVFTSKTLDQYWKNKGNLEFGSVTLESAGYVARYAAKKLVHGKDQDHDYHPIHKTSSRRAIGRTWIEKNWKHTFENGFVVLPNGQKSRIPRYYVDWLKKYRPLEWERYATTVREKIIEQTEAKIRKEEQEYFSNLWTRTANKNLLVPQTREKVKETILKSKFKRLQEHLKL
jgi:hypothetical protein